MQTHSNANKHARKVFNSARHALRWLERGIYPVPLEAGTKRPKGERNGTAKGANGWTNLRITPATASKYFKPGDNLGGLWGEPSAWAVDVDLDTPEAQAVARFFLPGTLIYGRQQAPASHYIFHCRNAETRKYHTKEIGMIVEIRSTGSQSVLPGSTHPSGDRYRIDHDVEIEEIKWSELKRQVGRLAGAAIAAHYYPEAGSRHDYVHAFTGALLHSHWQDADVRNFMEAVRTAATEDEEKSDRDGTIENTIKSYRGGGNVQGWPTLSQFMPGLDLQNLKRYLNIGNVMPDNIEAPDSIAAEPVGKINPRLLEVPGLVGDLAKWAATRSFVKQPIFNVAVGLMGVALATKNKYRIATLNTPLQPYMMCVAPTAGGKESALDSVYYLARKVGLKDFTFRQSQSYHAMLDLITRPPHCTLWLWDECARYMKSAARSMGSPEYAVLTHMISLYGKATSMSPGMPARKNAIPTLDYPFFCVMASAQPEQLLDAVSHTDMATGLVNRFLLFDAGENFARDNEERQDLFPTAIENRLLEFNKLKVPEGEFIDIQYETHEAWEILNDFKTFARETASKLDKGAETWGRAQQNALILAGIVAVGCDYKRPRISAEVAQWAVEFSMWSVERWLVRIEQSSSRSFTERNSKYIERIIRNPRALRHEAIDNKERGLVDRGVCPRSFLSRKCRHMQRREMDEVLTSLILGELICMSEIDDRECYWPRNSRPKAPHL